MRRKLTVALSTLTVLAGGVAIAPAASAAEDVVSIRVELDLPSAEACGDGPAVFEVIDAPIAVGPELTGADLVANPCDWLGSLSVDVDPATQTVTVGAEDDMDFQTALVRVSYPGIDGLTLTSDDLWGTVEGCTLVPALPTIVPGEGFSVLWTLGPDCEPDDSVEMLEGGTAVLTWTQLAPTTTTTAAPSTTSSSTTAAPSSSTTTAVPAAAAVVTPRFAG